MNDFFPVVEMSQKERAKSEIYKYFELTDDKKHHIFQVTCIMDGASGATSETICGTKISAFTTNDSKNTPTRAFNLKRHIDRHHINLSKAINENKNNIQEAKVLKRSASPLQYPIAKYFKSDKIIITMTQ